MKEVKMDILGRVNIPKSMRDNLNMQPDSKVFIEQVDDKVIITRTSINQECPTCKKLFSSEYGFCPYCGQYLQIRQPKEEKINE